jgi:predicted transcriptional regulator
MPNQRAETMAQTTCTLPREMIDRARELANLRLTSTSAIIRQALAEFLERDERQYTRTEYRGRE